MRNLLLPLGRQAILPFGRLLGRAIMDVTIEGKEHLPKNGEPVMVISNHFGWFDAPLLTFYLPFQPAFLIATESYRKWWVRAFANMFNCVPIWRGQVDRDAFKGAINTLNSGISLGVFPEGGINPELADRIARGEQIHQFRGLMSRRGGVLARAKPGTALLAVMSNVRILPAGLIGSENVLENVQNYRRSKVTLRLGPMFGPLKIEPGVRGAERRRRIDRLADAMMARVAALFPPEQRGPYRDYDPTLDSGLSGEAEPTTSDSTL